MAKITVKIPEELKKKIENMGVDVSPVVQEALEEKLKKIGEFERIVSKSQLTEEEAEELAREINKGVSARVREHVSRSGR